MAVAGLHLGTSELEERFLQGKECFSCRQKELEFSPEGAMYQA